jgi:hypothetical protein
VNSKIESGHGDETTGEAKERMSPEAIPLKVWPMMKPIEGKPYSMDYPLIGQRIYDPLTSCEEVDADVVARYEGLLSGLDGTRRAKKMAKKRQRLCLNRVSGGFCHGNAGHASAG